jgi:hypothetical protein
MRTLIVCLAVVLGAFHVDAFTCIVPQRQRLAARCIGQQESSSHLLLKSSKNDEILKLEEQLQKLKKEQSAEEVSAEKTTENGASVPEDEVLEEEVSFDSMLSERWKERRNKNVETKEAGVNNGLKAIFGAVGLVIVLALFSQVPIGQEDLSKYSAIKAPSEQIDLGDLNRVQKSNDLD